MPTDGQRIDDGSESVFWTEILTRVDQFLVGRTSHIALKRRFASAGAADHYGVPSIDRLSQVCKFALIR